MKQAIESAYPGWKPSCFMVDCAKNEKIAIHLVFLGILVYWCIFHIRKAWTKKLLEIIKTHDIQVEMNAALADILYGSTVVPDFDDPDSFNSKIC